MIVVYFTLTGNTEMFANKLDAKTLKITKYDLDTVEMDEPYLLLIPTYEPDATKTPFAFAKKHRSNLVGIVGSGNRNFGKDLFCYSAMDLADEVNAPIVHMYEFQGSINDVNKINEIVKSYEETGELDPKYIMKYR